METMRHYLQKFLPDPQTIRSNPWLRPFQSSLLHPRLWHLNRHSAAGAVAVGLFCGLIPGPLQMIGAAAQCAHLPGQSAFGPAGDASTPIR
jgi:uncharacterized protein (DUF2062 family)